MLKRILMVILVSCFLPVMAHAAQPWTLTTLLKSSGGTIQVTGKTLQTTVNLTVTASYPDVQVAGTTTVTVLPKTGYTVSKVIYNGTTLLNPTQTVFQVNGPTAQSVTAYFTTKTYSITATVAGNVGGTASPASVANLAYGKILTAPYVFTYTPTVSSTYALQSITGVPPTATVSAPLPASPGQAVTVTIPIGFTITSDIALVGTFSSQTPVARVTSSTPAYAGKAVTLDGSTSQVYAGTTYSWAKTSGPAGTLTNATSAVASFNPSAAGTYTLSLTLMPGGSTASTTVTVYADANAYVLEKCQNCHNGSGNPITLAPYQKWTTSKHEANYILCANCHSGADTGSHPGTVGDVCIGCHNATLGGSPAIAIGHNGITDTFKTVCTSCHDPHAAAAVPPGQPHFSNSTSAGNSASYKTSQSTCADCHNTTAANSTIRLEWKTTGHADINSPAWMSQDFKTLDTCVRCHTTTGFIAYSTAKVTTAWGTAADKTKEVLRCAGCHSNVAAGTVRTVTPNKPFASETGFTNHNVGASNVCMNCHGGTDNGNYIQSQVGTANFTNTPFQYNAHGMTAGGSLQGKTGFNFSGRSYANYSANGHSKIGMANSMGTGTVGPCVSCHMSAPNKHTFNAISSANGSIVQINTTVCTSCHNSTLPAATLDAKRVAFYNALEILRILLDDKGFTWNTTAATFYVGATTTVATNWGIGQAGANVMGAAHNYKLFISEPGAYTHNPAYAKQLITDSIDAAYNNGSVSGDISSALGYLFGKGKITNAQITSINSYKQADSSCNSCHGNPPASSGSGVVHPVRNDCSACHIYTGPGGVTHNNGVVDVSATCSSCHGNPPSSQSIHITGTVKYFHNQSTVTYSDCSQCHSTPATYAATAPHRDGIVEVLTNATACSSCHGYPPATVTGGAPHVNDINCANCHDYTTYLGPLHNNGTVNFKTGTAACSSCHGYPPASQTIHTNGAVQYNHDKVAVNYADCTQCHSTPVAPTATATHLNTKVDLLTNVNACNSCHTAPPATTAHSTATLAPFNCTNCHVYTDSSAATHNNGTVDFSGSLSCDTCHGYPPMSAAQLAARNTGEYVNAKVEDYTNGGGHHATHLPISLTAGEGFAPCLPCHPSVDLNLATHGQGGGTVQRANINVFYAADNGYVFDDARAKRYNTVAMSCSNISCHFQPTLSW